MEALFLHCWQADLTQPLDESCLSAAERARQARLRTPLLQRTYGRAHAFARQVLAGYAGVAPAHLAFGTDAHGKPTLAGGPHFNLAYRAGRALLALSDAGPVGADVEATQPLADAGALVRQLFSMNEQAALAAVGPASWWPLFYRLWTRKEAYAKALGLGLTLPFGGFSALHTAPAGAVLHSFADGAYAGAVAALGAARGLPLRRFVFEVAG